MAALQLPRAGHIPRSQIDALLQFKWDPSEGPLGDGTYALKNYHEQKSQPIPGNETVINAEVWFKSPALDEVTIRKINSVQLFAESHDQGFCNDESAGNWTWFELGIYQSPEDEAPRITDGGIELVWRSHYNNFKSPNYKWCEGDKFTEQHDFVKNLMPGNCIGVRLCSRFQAWKIHARNGYLVFELGHETMDRDAPPAYSEIISELRTIQDAIRDVNEATNAAFSPELSNGLLRADAFTSVDETPLRVLSLDGGGVRGLVTLHLLKAVFEKANITKDPHEVFDMIGGTSTGGLIAIMLGRLKMSLEECIQAYQVVMKKVFPEGFFKMFSSALSSGTRYSAKPLEDAIKDFVRQKLGDPDAKLLDPNPKNKCKIFVIAVRSDGLNNRAPVFLRSYQLKNPEEQLEFPDIKIWEAARATSAAPTYFEPLVLGNYQFLDGGLGANNPLGWLWTELLTVYGATRPTSTFLTIGTGMQPNHGLDNPANPTKVLSTVGTFTSVATNTELTHLLFRTLIDAFAPHTKGKKYFRLNVGKHVDAWEEKTGWFRKTTVYHPDNWESIGALDDINALGPLLKLTQEYIKKDSQLFDQVASSLTVQVKA
ncbi:hypothetical protein TWF481_003259 [Arthrobotrys musiformis]|uniref:PNPLA domain-containing protein n=1 Tax=Arthrobotrys musiformis TaxID=47236 RepID=A0AAV9VQ02_9PEZI